MLTHVATALRSAGCEPLVVGRKTAGDFPAVEDDFKDQRGPAAGLATILRLCNERDVALIATDQPLLNPVTVQRLLSLEGDAVVPVDQGIRQVTCAIYRHACLEPLEQALANKDNLSLQALLNSVMTREVPETEWKTWGEDGRSWWSLDTPKELSRAEDWQPDIGPPSPDR